MAARNQDSTRSDSASSSSICRTRPARTAARNRASAADGGDDKELDVDGIECTSGCCKSCVAGAIADGVAICCCPCAVVDLVAFVLVRVPWMVGRRCLAMARGKRKRKRIAECSGGGNVEPRRRSSGMSRNYLEKWRVSEGMIEVTTSFKFEDDEEDDGADERVWLELCRGFGRLSFTGIQSAGKGS
ncbi:hypothetical protein QQ045_007824 [Rhodiola kirilowii]